MNKKTYKKSKSSITVKDMSLGGLLVALSILALLLHNVIPNLKMTSWLISSLLVVVMMIESGRKAAMILVAATGLVAVFLLPNKMFAVEYLIFFGTYPLWKPYVDKLKIFPWQVVVKGVCFVLIAFATYKVAGALILNTEGLPYYIVWIHIIITTGMLGTYDFILTLFTGFYNKKIKKIPKKVEEIKLS